MIKQYEQQIQALLLLSGAIDLSRTVSLQLDRGCSRSNQNESLQ
jgi:hypothetical protein